MDLSGVISIGGMSGLYKVISQAKNGFIVESLADKKRMPAYSHYKISALQEISVFTKNEDMPLKDVFQKIFDKQAGAPAIDHKSADDQLKKFFSEAVPDHDAERVHTSDIRKIIMWYNMLQKTDLLTKKEESDDEAAALLSDTEKNKASQKLNVKDTSVKQVKTAAPKVKTQGVRKTGTA